MQNESNQLVVRNLVKEFVTSTGHLRILDDVSVEMDAGDTLAVIGPSGSGKSTFLHIVGTLDTATSGTIDLLGKNPFHLTEPELAGFRNQNIGFVFQEHHLLPQLSALENTLIPAIACANNHNDAASRAKTLLDRVGLADRADHRPGQLSGGERQRVAVARALFNQPKLLLADEPTGSLDRKNAESIGKLLLELQQQEKVMLVCVTHNDELASQFNRQVRLENGKFIELT